MSPSDSNTIFPGRRFLWPGRFLGLPPWLVSVALHIVLIVAIGLALRATKPRQGAAAERTAEVGIALKRQDGQHEFFVDQTDAGQTDAQAEQNVGTISRDQLLSTTAPSDPNKVLPSAPKVLGAGALGDEGLGNAAGATSGSSGRGNAGSGKARVQVFGTEGEGYKFVYVFDRSGSMGGSDARALRAAKAELLASLKSLNRTHQFQIIFYNQDPVCYNLSGQPGRLVFADERTKRLAQRYVGSIKAEGATRHEKALMKAIRMGPDVIFFLTDGADESRLSAGQIHDITRAAAGIMINAIEFGNGPQPDKDNYLKRLARATGGQYRYVNVWELKPD